MVRTTLKTVALVIFGIAAGILVDNLIAAAFHNQTAAWLCGIVTSVGLVLALFRFV